MKTTIVRRLLGGLAVLSLGTTIASASSITWYNNIFYTPDAPTSAVNTTAGMLAPTQYTVPFTTTVSIPKFDQTIVGNSTHKYELTSVQVVLNWVSTGTVTVQNMDSTAAHSFTNATSAVPVSITGPGSVTVNATAQAGPASGTVSQGTFVPGIGTVPGSFSTSLPSHSGTSNNTVIGSGLFAYEQMNAGVLTLPFTVTSGSANFGGTQVGGGSSLFFGGSANVGARIAVTYNYDVVPVPEPGTFMILGSALLGIGFFVRRRRA